MKRFRVLLIGLVPMVLAVLPGTAYAMAYRQYISKPLHFAIEYPTNWTADYSSSGHYVSFNQSSSAALTVNYHPASGLTIKSFTNTLVSNYRKLGLRIGAPQFSSSHAAFRGSGRLAGHNVVLRVATLIDADGAFSLAVAAPQAQFTRLTPIFKYMAGSFTTR